MSNELNHHGVLGQKWGKKNGPPYPLDYNKLSDEERAKAKKSAVQEGNIKEASFNKNFYSDYELQAVKNRFELNARVSQLARADIKTGQQKANELASKFETVERLTKAVANTATAGIRTYNALGMISAKINGTSFTPIGAKPNNQNQQQNKGNK